MGGEYLHTKKTPWLFSTVVEVLVSSIRQEKKAFILKKKKKTVFIHINIDIIIYIENPMKISHQDGRVGKCCIYLLS